MKHSCKFLAKYFYVTKLCKVLPNLHQVTTVYGAYFCSQIMQNHVKIWPRYEKKERNLYLNFDTENLVSCFFSHLNRYIGI